MPRPFAAAITPLLVAVNALAQNYTASVNPRGFTGAQTDPSILSAVYNNMGAGTQGPQGFNLGWTYDLTTDAGGPFVDPQILFYTSAASAVWKGQVFGQSNGRAAMWALADNIWNLPFAVPPHNPQWITSGVLGACDLNQVGYAQQGENFGGSGGTNNTAAPIHAMLWSGPGSMGTDLHNSQNNSHAVACDGGQQVGNADNNNGQSHAVLWSGTAKSQVDLHSGPFSSSAAVAIGGGLQAGWGSNIQNVPNLQGVLVKSEVHHALIWHGTPGSIQDLNPAGFAESMIAGMALGRQIGWGRPAPGFGPIHAMVWSGTAVSAIDLHLLLPPGYASSQAVAIDPATGTVFGFAYANGLVYWTSWTPAQ